MPSNCAYRVWRNTSRVVTAPGVSTFPRASFPYLLEFLDMCTAPHTYPARVDAKRLRVPYARSAQASGISGETASPGLSEIAPCGPCAPLEASMSKRTVVQKAGKTGRDNSSQTSASAIVLDDNYRPSDDEPFMNDRQRAYFRRKLQNWKQDIIDETRLTLAELNAQSQQHADLADRATSETDRALELRARDRQRKLVSKIDAALSRLDDGSYGYCEETGEPIGLKRLDARPIATLSLEAQERHERRERVYRED